MYTIVGKKGPCGWEDGVDSVMTKRISHRRNVIKVTMATTSSKSKIRMSQERRRTSWQRWGWEGPGKIGGLERAWSTEDGSSERVSARRAGRIYTW